MRKMTELVKGLLRPDRGANVRRSLVSVSWYKRFSDGVLVPPPLDHILGVCDHFLELSLWGGGGSTRVGVSESALRVAIGLATDGLESIGAGSGAKSRRFSWDSPYPVE